MSVKLTAQWCQNVFNFDYTGKEQTFNSSDSCGAGYYKLEAWGAQGGNVSGKWDQRGGYGAYSIGISSLNKDQKLYINVGGQGNSMLVYNVEIVNGNSYNGGGGVTFQASHRDTSSGGGGATHIAMVSGLLQNLSSYKDTGGTNISKEILIVAGGGGGANSNYDRTDTHHADGGNAGGIKGNTGSPVQWTQYTSDAGGTQTSGGKDNNNCGDRTVDSSATFGKGCSACKSGYTTCLHTSGGGGWYGGGCPIHSGGAGGGGSGYIGSSNLISGLGVAKHMTCYSCTTSTAEATRTNSNTITPTSTPTADVARIGNGYARITWMGDTL